MSTTAQSAPDTAPSVTPTPGGRSVTRQEVDWRRLRSTGALLALISLAVAALGQTVSTVVAGRLAEQPSPNLVALLAACLLGGAALETVGRYLWAGVVDRAAGRLREDLLDAALHQPLAALSEQAVGEILDRVDDDTHEVGTLARGQLWQVLRAALAMAPTWIVAAVTWWPAWILFPVAAIVTVAVMKPQLALIAERKIAEEIIWTDHAAALEETVAGRDDLRTNLGQAFAIQRLTSLSAAVHERFHRVVIVEKALSLRAGLTLHGLLSVVLIAGVALTTNGALSIAQLVTLFLITASFAGQINNVMHQLPELQAGLGAITRIRQLMAAEPEAAGGRDLPNDDLDLRFNDVNFAYPEGTFALQGIDLNVPSGHTLALVGRTGSGKSTLAALVSRAIEPAPGSVFLGGVDVLDLDLHALREGVGVVTQRTEVLAGTLHDNITLFADIGRDRVEAVIDELALTDWVAALPDGLDTLLGPGGATLSAGEEQLLAFARLLVREVRVVVLDEATARMDPLTEGRVVAAAENLLRGRTGILVAHRLSTIQRAELVAVLHQGRVVQSGLRRDLSRLDGPFRDLLRAADAEHERSLEIDAGAHLSIGAPRRRTDPILRPDPGSGPSLARGVCSALRVRPAWGLVAVVLFAGSSLLSSFGALTSYLWGRTVESLDSEQIQWAWVAALVAGLLTSPGLLAEGVVRYPRWWVEVLLRVRMSVLAGQTAQRRLRRAPAGEIVARAMDADRYARYADRWVDFVTGLLIAVVTAVISGSLLAGLVLLGVLLASAVASALGRPMAGRSAAQSSAARAAFGRALVSTLESVRTVKLAGRTPHLHRHLRAVDSGRVEAAVREHRVQAVLDGVPTVTVQLGVVSAWAALTWQMWSVATALLVVNAVNNFDWFGRVAGAVVTEAPGTRAWQRATSELAGGVDLMTIPDGVDLLTGHAPPAPQVPRIRLEELTLRGVSAVHDDGTVGVDEVTLTVRRGELVLLIGQVGSGKSSLLGALAGLLDHRGAILWNGVEVDDAEIFLRPGQVAHVAQVPRVLSGTFADNVQLGYTRNLQRPLADARLMPDVESAGGPHALIGHRGVRLSGGQVQRLALARALAADTELLLGDDVSSALDATTEIELWRGLRQRSVTVIAATSKRSALAQADRVVVLQDGRVAAVGPWPELAEQWGHLAG